MNFSQIYEGWRNRLLTRSERIESLSAYRMEICKNCIFHSENRKQKLNYSTLRMDVHCVDCGCTLSAKTRCISCECPQGLWKAEHINEDDNEGGKGTFGNVNEGSNASV
jgi:hypothetical protein